MITEDRERDPKGKCAIDRISSLPSNIIEYILEHLQTRDAARTCVLSRNWRYIWAEFPNLVLDRKFCEEIMQNKSSTQFQSDYVSLVNRILLQPLGTIQKFVIDLPELHSTQYFDIDQWMLFISRKGVRQLNLNNSNPIPYKIPCCIFYCPELIQLSVTKCIFRVPNGFKCFRKLTLLYLEEITFGSSVLDIPQLVTLCVVKCSGVHLLHVSAPLLQNLILFDNDALELSHYMISKKLKIAYIGLPNEIQHHRRGERISLTKLCGCWTVLSYVRLDGRFLEYLAAGTVPERHPTTMDCLRHLVLFRVSFALDQIACILWLIQSSPRLDKFEISTDPVVSNNVEVLNYLEEPGQRNRLFYWLRTVKARYFQGSKPELLFAKLLLACSPSLERMSIEEDVKLCLNERLRIAKELMRFSRASTKAEMIFEPLIITST